MRNHAGVRKGMTLLMSAALALAAVPTMAQAHGWGHEGYGGRGYYGHGYGYHHDFGRSLAYGLGTALAAGLVYDAVTQTAPVPVYTPYGSYGYPTYQYVPPAPVVRYYYQPAPVVRYYYPPAPVVRYYYPPAPVVRYYYQPRW